MQTQIHPVITKSSLKNIIKPLRIQISKSIFSWFLFRLHKKEIIIVFDPVILKLSLKYLKPLGIKISNINWIFPFYFVLHKNEIVSDFHISLLTFYFVYGDLICLYLSWKMLVWNKNTCFRLTNGCVDKNKSLHLVSDSVMI